MSLSEQVTAPEEIAEVQTLLKALELQNSQQAIERTILSLSPKQLRTADAWASRKYKRIGALGSNRSGKTYGGAAAYAQYLRDEAPPNTEHLCVTISSAMSAKGQQKLLWELIPHEMFDVEWTGPKNGFGSKNPIVILDKRTPDNPKGRNVVIYFMTQSQHEDDRNAFEMMTIETVWADESISEELYSAVSARLTTSDDGRMLMTTIPGAEWVHEQVYINDDPTLWFELYDWTDNPVMTEEKWLNFCKSVPLHERDIRIEGKPAIAGTIVYPEFDRDRHIVPHSFVHADACWYAGMDEGMDHPTAWLLVAINPDGKMVVYDEYISRNQTIEQDVSGIKALAGDKLDKLVWPTVADPAMWQSRKAGMSAMLYEAAGLELTKGMPTSKFGENQGVAQIKEMLRHDELYVTSSCQHTVRNFALWKYKRDQQNRPLAKDAYEDKNNDALDALRYLITVGPVFKRGGRQKATVIS